MKRHIFKKIATLSCLLMILCAQNLLAVNFVYTHSLNEAQRNLAALRLVKAQTIIQHELTTDANNVASDYLLEYVEFYKIMVNQNKALYDHYEIVKNKTIDRVKKLSDKDPAKLYLLGSLHFHGAFVKSLFDEYVSAAFEFRSAYQLLEENHKNFPSYLSNQKDLGALKALIGTFPESYRWIVSAVGLKGDYDGGMAMLKNYISLAAKEPVIEQQQANIFYALIQLNFGSDKNVAWQFYKEHAKEYTGNLMQNYVRAYIAGKCGHNDEAIAILHARPATSDYEQVPYINYLMGCYLLNKLETDAAIWFKKFTITSQSNTSIKEAYQRLSWCALLQKDTSRFLVYHRLMSKSGKGAGSEEILISKDLISGVYPNVELIKARLLFDGGYFEKSGFVLKSLNPATLLSRFQQIEFEYRWARVDHEMKDYAKAIIHYNKTLEYAKGIDTYMAPYTCLQLGLLYSTLHYNANAKEYLNRVADYNHYDYKSSVQQKAKAALIQID